MKKIHSLCLLLILVTLTTTNVWAQDGNVKLKSKDQIVGIWVYKGIRMVDMPGMPDKFQPMPPIIIKVFYGDKTYKTIKFTNIGPVISGGGEYEIKNGVFIEKVFSNDKALLKGRTNNMQICFSPDGNAMACTWAIGKSNEGEVFNTEYWERVEEPNPFKQPSKLNTQQKVEGMKESDLPQEDKKPKLIEEPGKEETDKGKEEGKSLALR